MVIIAFMKEVEFFLVMQCPSHTYKRMLELCKRKEDVFKDK